MKRAVSTPALRFVEVEQAAKEERPDLGNGGADGVALLAEDVPEGDGAGGEGEVVDLELLYPVGNFRVVDARLADAGEVSLNVGGKDGDADAAEGFGHYLQGDGFAGAGGAGDQTMAVRHGRQEVERVFAPRYQQWIRHCGIV